MLRLHGEHGWGNGDDDSDENEVRKHVTLRFDIQEPNHSLLHCLLVHSEDLLLLVPNPPKHILRNRVDNCHVFHITKSIISC